MSASCAMLTNRVRLQPAAITLFPVHRMKRPVSIEIIDEGERLFVVLTYPDGEVERQLVDPTLKAKRKPRKPIARAGLWKGRKKGV